MGRLIQLVSGLILLPALAGCHGPNPPEAAAYLAAVESVVERTTESVSLNFPAGASVCFASTFWPEGKKALPDYLQHELIRRGWTLFDTGLAPSPNTVLVFVSEPTPPDEQPTIAVGYQVWQLHGDEVDVWGDQWDFRMNCQQHPCSVTETPGGSHYHAASTPVAEYLVREGGNCSGSIPRSIGEGTPRGTGTAGGTVP
jgi:hypothetical protein